MPEEKQIYKRASAVPRKISGIDPEKDIRVLILGRVVEKSDGTLVIDDGSASAEVVTDSPQPVSVNDMVRVFSRVLPLENGCELRAEIVQNMNMLDMDLYRKVYG